jgi:hypothetical protein
MTRKKPIEWTRLDNAAKIFPPTCNEKDTKVFRFICELKDDIDRSILQDALEHTLDLFPLYRSIIRKGVFWYYFERTELRPEVKEEYRLPCSMLYRTGRKNLLFEVTYYKKRINLEVFHALADGTGALGFLKTLLYFYIIKRYPEAFLNGLPQLDYDASISQKMDDSFLKHYTGNAKLKKIKLPKAYRILGRRTIDNRIRVIEGQMSVKEMMDLSHRYHTTMTVFLTALFLYAIYKEMPGRSRKYPVVLSIPVNLRSYFPSDTARNFFGTINVSYDFSNNMDSFEQIIGKVKECFGEELTEENLKKHMNHMAALEHNVLTRIVPLSIKDMVLKLANILNERGITANLTNLGKITMTKELSPYIHLFSVLTSTKRPQICMCSYEDQLVVSFVSPFVATDIQERFFRILTKEGIKVAISANRWDN